MKKSTLRRSLVAALLLVPAVALAKPQVTIGVNAEKEISTVVNGKKTVKLVPAKKIAPNETIIYTLSYLNKGDEKATNAVIEDAIPKGTAYVPESATSTSAVDAQFSIDHGKTFAKPAQLSREVKVGGKTERRTASSDEYTNIRWTISEIPAGAGGKVSFKVKVK